MTDEIRKAAEEIYFTYDRPRCHSHKIEVIDEANIKLVEHAIREDRKRRDDLEAMLIELAERSSSRLPHVRWECSKSGTLTPIHTTAEHKRYKSPSEAARAALDELKGKGGAE